MNKVKLLFIVLLSMAIGAAGGALAYRAYADVPAIYQPLYAQVSREFVEKVYSDTAKETTYPLIAKDAESLQKLIGYRQAWCKEEGIDKYQLVSREIKGIGYGQGRSKRNFQTSVQTVEQYQKPNGEMETIDCFYALFFEIRDGEWCITKAIANDRAGKHFFPPFEQDRESVFVYHFEHFDDDVKKLASN